MIIHEILNEESVSQGGGYFKVSEIYFFYFSGIYLNKIN